MLEPSPWTEGRPIEPIRMSARVRRPIVDAFRLFTEEIGSWWPVQTHYARGPVVGMVFEGRVGGRIYEQCADGESVAVAEVLLWEPPHRLILSWHPSVLPTTPTEIEVRFFSEDAHATRVELEHRGWERLGARAHQQRTAYLNGWPTVWGCFQAKAVELTS